MFRIDVLFETRNCSESPLTSFTLKWLFRGTAFFMHSLRVIGHTGSVCEYFRAMFTFETLLIGGNYEVMSSRNLFFRLTLRRMAFELKSPRENLVTPLTREPSNRLGVMEGNVAQKIAPALAPIVALGAGEPTKRYVHGVDVRTEAKLLRKPLVAELTLEGEPFFVHGIDVGF